MAEDLCITEPLTATPSSDRRDRGGTTGADGHGRMNEGRLTKVLVSVEGDVDRLKRNRTVDAAANAVASRAGRSGSKTKARQRLALSSTTSRPLRQGTRPRGWSPHP